MIKKIISALLILIGLLVLLYPAISELYDNHQQQKLIEEWQESLPAIDYGDISPQEDEELVLVDIPIDTPSEADNEAYKALEKEEAKKLREEYIKKHMEGMLKIEKINLYLPILKDATKQNMNISVASMENTGMPGEIGNYCIAGHRNRTYGRNFNRLDEVETGDTVEVDNGENIYKYIVTEKLYVKPDEVWVLKKNKKEKEITLITCHPMGNPTHRLIIKGKIADF